MGMKGPENNQDMGRAVLWVIVNNIPVVDLLGRLINIQLQDLHRIPEQEDIVQQFAANVFLPLRERENLPREVPRNEEQGNFAGFEKGFLLRK